MNEITIKKHNISDIAYVVEMTLEKNYHGYTHAHKYDHLAMLLKGQVVMDGIERTSPCVIEIRAGINYEVFAKDNVVWACIHSNNEPDIRLGA